MIIRSFKVFYLRIIVVMMDGGTRKALKASNLNHTKTFSQKKAHEAAIKLYKSYTTICNYYLPSHLVLF